MWAFHVLHVNFQIHVLTLLLWSGKQCSRPSSSFILKQRHKSSELWFVLETEAEKLW